MRIRIRVIVMILVAVMIFTCAAARGECVLQDLLSRIEDSENPVAYTLATAEYGEMTPPEDYSPISFVSVLLQADIEPADLSETPEGEYVVLSFPEEHVLFDFFLAEEEESYFRQVSADGSEELFTAELPDDVFISLGQMMEMEADLLALMSESQSEFEEDWPEDGWVQTSLDGMLWINRLDLLEVVEENDEIVVNILHPDSPEEATEWMYLCYYEALDDTLRAVVFSCNRLTYDDKGKENRKNEFIKTCRAVFSVNKMGQLVIRDAEDDRLEGKVFEKIILAN